MRLTLHFYSIWLRLILIVILSFVFQRVNAQIERLMERNFDAKKFLVPDSFIQVWNFSLYEDSIWVKNIDSICIDKYDIKRNLVSRTISFGGYKRNWRIKYDSLNNTVLEEYYSNDSLLRSKSYKNIYVDKKLSYQVRSDSDMRISYEYYPSGKIKNKKYISPWGDFKTDAIFASREPYIKGFWDLFNWYIHGEDSLIEEYFENSEELLIEQTCLRKYSEFINFKIIRYDSSGRAVSAEFHNNRSEEFFYFSYEYDKNNMPTEGSINLADEEHLYEVKLNFAYHLF